MNAELGPNIAELTGTVEKKYGLKTTALRLVGRLPNYHCIELELHGRASRRLQAVWVGLDDYSRIRGGGFVADDPFAHWLTERTRGAVPAQRPPWELPGWYAGATHWIDIQLDRLNIQATGSVLQTRALSHSGTILKVPTSVGILYFKASYDRAPREVPLTRFLADLWPGRVTHPVAFCEKRNWMLMRGPSQDEAMVSSNERLVRAAGALGSIQVESVAQLDRFKNLGCEALGILQLRKFLLDDFSVQLHHALDAAGFSKERQEKLGLLALPLAEQCEQLASYTIPETLVHVDFKSRNFFVSADAVQIIDWQRACIGLPFFSLLTLARIDVDWDLDHLDQDPVVRSYLACFSDFESEQRLYEAMKLVGRLYLAWRLWYRLRELKYFEPNSQALFKAYSVISNIASRMLDSEHAYTLNSLTY